MNPKGYVENGLVGFCAYVLQNRCLRRLVPCTFVIYGLEFELPEIGFIDIMYKRIILLQSGYVILNCIILESFMILVENVVSVWDSIKELLMEIHGKVSTCGGTPLLWRTFCTFPDTTA